MKAVVMGGCERAITQSFSMYLPITFSGNDNDFRLYSWVFPQNQAPKQMMKNAQMIQVPSVCMSISMSMCVCVSASEDAVMLTASKPLVVWGSAYSDILSST